MQTNNDILLILIVIILVLTIIIAVLMWQVQRRRQLLERRREVIERENREAEALLREREQGIGDDIPSSATSKARQRIHSSRFRLKKKLEELSLRSKLTTIETSTEKEVKNNRKNYRR